MNRNSIPFLRKMQRDERGGAILLTALAMFTMVVAVGAAIDLSRNHTLQTNVGTALDAATLAAANASINVPCEVDANNQDELQAWVQSQGAKYFNMNLPPEYLNSTDPSSNKLTFTLDTTAGLTNTSVTGYSSMMINSSVMQIVGDNSVPVTTCSQVHIPLASDLGPSAQQPSPHTQGDPTTGLFSPTPTSGQVSISNNSVENVRVDKNGNMRVGTINVNNAVTKLEVGGGGMFNGRIGSETQIQNAHLNTGQGNGQGAYISWNENNGGGVTDFSNQRGLGTGGFEFNLFDGSGNYLYTPVMINPWDFLIVLTSTGTTSPRLGMIDTQLGDVNTAPVWYVDNNHDAFRIFREPNRSSPGSTYFITDTNGNTGIGGANTTGAPNNQQTTVNVATTQGNWTPLGTLDIEKPAGNATLCLNGKCVTSLSASGGNIQTFNVSLATMDRLSNSAYGSQCSTTNSPNTNPENSSTPVQTYMVTPACNAACDIFCTQHSSSFVGGSVLGYAKVASAAAVCGCVTAPTDTTVY